MFGAHFTTSSGYVGIDVAHDCLRLLQLHDHRTNGLTVVGAAIVDLDRDSAGKVDGDRLAQRLKAATGSGRFTSRQCVLSLPRGESLLQSVRLPGMPDAELEQAVHWEAAQRFNSERDELEVDFIRTGATLQGGENREEVLLVAATRESLGRWLEPVVQAGLRPVAVEQAFTALARTYSRQSRREADQEHVRIVIDVGSTGSTVIILRGDQIAFCKPLPIGGEQFTQALAEHLQLDLDAAAELRAARVCRSSDAPDPATDRAVYEAVRPLLGDLVKEVMLCARYYGVTFRGQPPSHVYLTGGDGLEPHLRELIEQTCKIRCTQDDESGTLERLIGSIYRHVGRVPGPAASWAVAIGLSLRPARHRRVVKPQPVQAPLRRGAA